MPNPTLRPLRWKAFCKRGHSRTAIEGNRGCSECNKLRQRRGRTTEQRVRRRNKYALNREHINTVRKEYEARNKPRIKARQRRHARLPEPTRPEPTLCESCGNPPGKMGLHLDHCHTTGAFRGWLCGRCNLGIGNLGDSLPGVLRAAAYLQRNGTHADLLGSI